MHLWLVKHIFPNWFHDSEDFKWLKTTTISQYSENQDIEPIPTIQSSTVHVTQIMVANSKGQSHTQNYQQA